MGLLVGGKLGSDYPRVCGGTYVPAYLPDTDGGLSPRMRGNHTALRLETLGAGTIPAYAGEPVIGGGTGGRFRDYPRVCGGTPSTPYRVSTGPGLSPRMRGSCHHGSLAPFHLGCIPARAGSAGLVAAKAVWEWGASPRVRGSDGWIRADRHAFLNLSPGRPGSTRYNTLWVCRPATWYGLWLLAWRSRRTNCLARVFCLPAQALSAWLPVGRCGCYTFYSPRDGPSRW